MDKSPFIFLEESIKFCFGIICHQNESILYPIGDGYLPLCPRCVGLHIGFFGLFIISIFIIRIKFLLKNNGSYFLLFFAISITAIHWISGYIGLLEMNSSGRLFTGIISGAGVYFLTQTYQSSFVSNTNKNETNDYTKSKILFSTVIVIAVTIYLVTYSYHLLLIAIFFVVIFNISQVVKAIILSLLTMSKNNSSTINYEVLK